MSNDTITAISTPMGHGAIGLVRISGSDAINILAKIFHTKKALDISSVPSHTIHYGQIIEFKNGSNPIDEAMVAILRAPNTYTKEDTVEINCHGNPIVMQKILETTIHAGARLADPGEFTKRAFINGRIDLSQAEAVIDLIYAKTEESVKLAQNGINGEMSICIKNIQHALIETLISLETEIEFPDDNVSKIDIEGIYNKLGDISSLLRKLVNSYNEGKIVKTGVSVSIIGKTNVGKSSLFNILVGSKERSIVSPIASTTRDLISEPVIINGRLFNFTDTAGFKKPAGLLQKKSIEFTWRCIENSDIILYLLDGSKLITHNDIENYKKLPQLRVIMVINKIDLPLRNNNIIKKLFQGKNIIKISCKNSLGIDDLKAMVYSISNARFKRNEDSEVILTNLRQKEILQHIYENVEDAKKAIEKKLSHEFIANDLRQSLEKLQEITGENVPVDILDQIFSKFCIGK